MVKLGFVVSEFNYDITQMMVKRAEEHAKFLGAEVTEIVNVPGAFDMPLAIKRLLEKSEIDAAVTLGAVIEGGTAHDDIVAGHCARKVMDLALEYNKPVGLGISGPKMTRQQAAERIDSYAKRAVETAVKLCEKKN